MATCHSCIEKPLLKKCIQCQSQLKADAPCRDISPDQLQKKGNRKYVLTPLSDNLEREYLPKLIQRPLLRPTEMDKRS